MPKTMDFKWECTIDNWIRHAGDLPLSFALSESRACRANRPSRCSRCRQLQARIFEKYSDRIYHLEGVTSHLFETLSKKSLKNIHSLIVDVPYPMVEASQLWNINPRFSPNFRQLRLAGTKDTYMALGLGTCLRNLTHLSGHVVGRVFRTFFFHVFPNLQGAVVHYSSLAYYNPTTLANEETVILPQLTTLTVFFPKDSAIDLTNFLYLNMSLLITLRLGSISLHSFALMSFAEESMKHIYHRLKDVQQLSLIFNYVSGHEFMDLLFHLPDLEKLDIQDIGEIVSNFRDLQDRSIIPSLPSLRTITLDINRLIDIDFHNFHVNLTTFALKRLPDSVTKQGPSENLHIKFYFSGLRIFLYRLFENEKFVVAQGLKQSFLFWNKEYHNHRSRWMHRLENEEGGRIKIF